MSATPIGPSLQYLGAALFMVGAAYSIMRWVSRTMREQLGSNGKRSNGPNPLGQPDAVPPMLVKRAIERGLVSASQLAAMAPMERQFFFASLKDRLDAPATSGATSIGASPIGTSMAPAAPLAALAALASSAARLSAHPQGLASHAGSGAAPPPGSHAMNGAEFGLVSVPVNDKLHMHCPMCGAALDLPAFAPYVGHCSGCGTRTAMREDVPGHYILNVAPALKPVTAPAPASA